MSETKDNDMWIKKSVNTPRIIFSARSILWILFGKMKVLASNPQTNRDLNASNRNFDQLSGFFPIMMRTACPQQAY